MKKLIIAAVVALAFIGCTDKKVSTETAPVEKKISVKCECKSVDCNQHCCCCCQEPSCICTKEK